MASLEQSRRGKYARLQWAVRKRARLSRSLRWSRDPAGATLEIAKLGAIALNCFKWLQSTADPSLRNRVRSVDKKMPLLARALAVVEAHGPARDGKDIRAVMLNLEAIRDEATKLLAYPLTPEQIKAWERTWDALEWSHSEVMTKIGRWFGACGTAPLPAVIADLEKRRAMFDGPALDGGRSVTVHHARQ